MSLAGWKKTFPGMPNSKKYWKVFENTAELLPQVELYYGYWNLEHHKDQYFIEQMEDFVSRTREVRLKMNTDTITSTFQTPYLLLGNCTEATTPPAVDMTATEVRLREAMWFATKADCQQGNNPMRIETTNATAYVTSTKSDDAISRDYLLNRLLSFDSWRDTKPGELQKLFNIDGPTTPTTTQGLIDAIKNDKFKLDDKKLAWIAENAEEHDMTPEEYADEYGFGYGPLSYIIFTDLPKADRKGYDEAMKEYAKQKILAKDIIMTAPPADGLKALQALEAWMPTGKAN